MNRYTGSLLITCLLLFACGEADEVQPPVYELMIVVTDTLQQPLVGAWVNLFNEFEELRAEKTQNPQGLPGASTEALQSGMTDVDGRIVFFGIIRPGSVINGTLYTSFDLYVRTTALRVAGNDTTYLTNDVAIYNGPTPDVIKFDNVTGGGQQVAKTVTIEVK